MGETTLTRIDDDLVKVLEEVRLTIAEELKKKYGLSKVTVYGSLSSQVVAAAFKKKKISFKIDKTGLNEGVINCSSCISF